MNPERKDSLRRQREFLLKHFLARDKSVKKIRELLEEEFKGEDIIGRNTMNTWMHRFRLGKRNVDDEDRNGRPLIAVDERVGDVLATDPYANSVDIACRLKIPFTRVRLYLKRNELLSISGMWVRMTEELRMTRISYCKEMIETIRDISFWDNVVFEGERIIYYNKGQGRNGKGSVKHQLRCHNSDSATVEVKVAFLRLWWTTRGYLRFQFCPMELVTIEQYQNQLHELYADLQVHGMILPGQSWTLHRNTATYKSLHATISEILEQFGWSEMLHPSHCPDLSPTDCFFVYKYMLALNTYNAFETLEEIEDFTTRSFEKRKQAFYQESVAILPGRWHRVIETDGEFIATNEKCD